MKSFIVENTWKKTEIGGWGNGYIAIPKSSTWHGVNYDQIPVDTHGGLTWSSLAKDMLHVIPDDIEPDAWVIGFHTYRSSDAHAGMGTVSLETDMLLTKMAELNKTPYAKENRIMIACPHCAIKQDITHLKDEYGYQGETQLFCCFDCSNSFYLTV